MLVCETWFRLNGMLSMPAVRIRSISLPPWTKTFGLFEQQHRLPKDCYRRSLTPFLPATVFLGPFLVRAFVLVRWPRTGNPSRWRMPR